MPTPTGTVNFFDGGVLIAANVPLVNGVATIATTFHFAGGAHNLSAVYSGDSNFLTSTGTLTENITQIPTSATMTAAPNPGFNNQLISVTAFLTANPPATDGSFAFQDGTITIGTVPIIITAQDAVLNTYALSNVGAHHLTATYTSSSGDWAPSSAIFTETIRAFAPTTLPGMALIGTFLTTGDNFLPSSASLVVIPGTVPHNSPFTLVWSTSNVAQIKLIDSGGFVNTGIVSNPGATGGSFTVSGIPTPGVDTFTLFTYDQNGNLLPPAPTTSLQIT